MIFTSLTCKGFWNNPGMHCMDDDYSVLSILLLYTAISIPYNSMIGVVSPDPEDRAGISTYKLDEKQMKLIGGELDASHKQWK